MIANAIGRLPASCRKVAFRVGGPWLEFARVPGAPAWLLLPSDRYRAPTVNHHPFALRQWRISENTVFRFFLNQCPIHFNRTDPGQAVLRREIPNGLPMRRFCGIPRPDCASHISNALVGQSHCQRMSPCLAQCTEVAPDFAADNKDHVGAIVFQCPGLISDRGCWIASTMTVFRGADRALSNNAAPSRKPGTQFRSSGRPIEISAISSGGSGRCVPGPGKCGPLPRRHNPRRPCR